jgi:hypothetical protein
VRDVINDLPQDTKDEISTGCILKYISYDTKALYQTFADLADDPFEFRKIYDIDSFDVNRASWSALSSIMDCGFKYNLSVEYAIAQSLDALKNKYPLIAHININNKSIPLVKEYIEAMNR